MHEPAPTREDELAARAAETAALTEDELAARAEKAGVVFRPIPPWGKYLVIICPDAVDVEICVDLEDAERDIAALE